MSNSSSAKISIKLAPHLAAALGSQWKHDFDGRPVLYWRSKVTHNHEKIRFFDVSITLAVDSDNMTHTLGIHLGFFICTDRKGGVYHSGRLVDESLISHWKTLGIDFETTEASVLAKALAQVFLKWSGQGNEFKLESKEKNVYVELSLLYEDIDHQCVPLKIDFESVCELDTATSHMIVCTLQQSQSDPKTVSASSIEQEFLRYESKIRTVPNQNKSTDSKQICSGTLETSFKYERQTSYPSLPKSASYHGIRSKRKRKVLQYGMGR
jgi:hypothetical protein